MPAIRIDRLEIRLKGTTPSAAREATANLSSALSEQLAAIRPQLHGEGEVAVSRIEAGCVSAAGENAGSLVRTVAQRVAQTVSSATHLRTAPGRTREH
jgi:hypothetical protein